mgnify:CR=1 FL=1
MSDDQNMSMRKFLKQVGVTSQQAIEEAMHAIDSDDAELQSKKKKKQNVPKI